MNILPSHLSNPHARCPTGTERIVVDELDALFLLPAAPGRPLRPVPAVDRGLDPVDRRLLLLLAEGRTDEGIARELFMSVRTVQRRVKALLTQLDATSRFQAGVRATSRGWL